MPNTTFAHIKDQALMTALIDRGLLSRDVLQGVLSEQNRGFQAATNELKGLLYELFLRERCLRVKESIGLSSLAEVELSPNEKTAFDPEHWRNWGQGILLLDPQKPVLAGAIQEHELPVRGLVLSPSTSYIYTPELVHQPYLGLSQELIDPSLSREITPSAGPYDLYISPQGKRVCVVDRAAGDLTLLSNLNHTPSEVYSLREPGSRLCLNLAFDDSKGLIYFTDNEAPYLSVLDIQAGSLEQYTLDPEIPGNLLLNVAKQKLYLLILSPKPLLRLLDLNTLATLQEVPLDGELWSQVGLAPTDLLYLTPHYLAVLLRQPVIGLPRLVFLNPQDLSLMGAEILNTSLPPSQLAMAGPNPLRQQVRKLTDLLLEQGLVDAEKLLELFPPPLPPEKQTVLEIVSAETLTVESFDEGGALLSHSEETLPPPQESPPPPHLQPLPKPIGLPSTALLQLSPIESVSHLAKPHRMDNLPLPESAEEVILQILTASFYAQTGQDIDGQVDALEKLREQANYVRIRLQDYDSARVFVPDLLRGKALQTLVLRDSILTMLELQAAPARQPYNTPPTHCPDCHTPLLGSWDCHTCGLELLDPERALKRKIASAHPQTWLPSGYFAVPDVNEGRLLLVNTHRFNYVTWQMNLKVLPGVRQPWDMLWLSDFHVLVTDRQANAVFECDPGGREVWRLASESDPQLHLFEPVKATRYSREIGGNRYLIVDKGHHRVFEVDSEQKISWQWGEKGKKGNHPLRLNQPSDIQYTHEMTYLLTDTGNDRILEIRADKVFRTFGDNLELSRPVAAQRLFNGDTLIADAGHYRLLIVDDQGDIRHECTYFRPGLDERFRMDEPLHMVRRENQNVVLIDRNRVMELNPIAKKIVWFSFLHQLHLDIAAAEMPTEAPYQMDTAKAFEQYQEQPSAEVITLQAMIKAVPLFANAPWEFYDKLEKILHMHHFRPGELILQEGKLGRSMFFILNGQVELISSTEAGPTMLLEAGDSFGYMGIIFTEPRKSTVRARTACTVCELEKKELDVLLEHYPAMAKHRQSLAQERLVVAKLKKTPSSAGAASRLQSLIAEHKQRAQASLHTSSGPQRNMAQGEKQAHRLQYTEIETRLIALAESEKLTCLELIVTLSRTTRMKAARVALIVHVLDKLGTLIKTAPSPEDILAEKIGYEVIFALLTAATPEQVVEDLSAIVEVEGVSVLPVRLEQLP
ncbi:MAG: cyclic nucleotide-binding domain-containing protein [Candidatus Sericytochromatia bacterium]|nr:cyclic nucleotide-binding domain-containing protein [Candidatus Sericytochromatia bacterium]